MNSNSRTLEGLSGGGVGCKKPATFSCLSLSGVTIVSCIDRLTGTLVSK